MPAVVARLDLALVLAVAARLGLVLVPAVVARLDLALVLAVAARLGLVQILVVLLALEPACLPLQVVGVELE